MVSSTELAGAGAVVANFTDCVSDWLWTKTELTRVGFRVCGKARFASKTVRATEANLPLALSCSLVSFSSLLGSVNVLSSEVKKKVAFFRGFFVVKEFFFTFSIMTEMKGGSTSSLCILGQVWCSNINYLFVGFVLCKLFLRKRFFGNLSGFN